MVRPIVFGGASGIGAAIAQKLDRPYIVDRVNVDGVDLCVEFPLRDPMDWHPNGYFDRVFITMGRPSNRLFDDTTPSGEAELMRMNFEVVTSALRFIKPWVVNGGSFTLTSSVSAQRADPSGAIYAAAKAGLEALVRNLAREWIPTRVNAVAPGPTATEQFMKNVPLPNLDKERWRSPAHVLLDPAEVADAAIALSKLTGVSGVVLPVDMAGLSSSRRQI